MKLKGLLFVFFTLSYFFIYSQEGIKVLFVGNSYTYVNDLPNVVKELATSQNKTIETTEFHTGGAQFSTHWNNQSLINTIEQGGFDFMVLQGQSQEVAFPQSQFYSEVYPYAKSLDSLFKVYNHNGKVAFFMTWGYRYGDAANCPYYPPYCNYWSMTQELYNNYRQMAFDFNSMVSPIGAAWRYSIILDSNFVLHSSDNSHPSIKGTYLAACVLYSTLFMDSVNSGYYNVLSAADAQRLQQISNTIVFDSLSSWNMIPPSNISDNNTNKLLFNITYLQKEKTVNVKVNYIKENAEIIIYNILGNSIKRVFVKPINNSINTFINVNDFSFGTYIVRINSGELFNSSKLIIN
jgi:hypothetical protein